MRSYESDRRRIGAIEIILGAICLVTIVFATNEYFDIVYVDRVMEALGIC